MSNPGAWRSSNSVKCNWLGVAFFLGPLLALFGMYLILFQVYVPNLDAPDQSNSFWNAGRNLIVGLVTGLVVVRLGERQLSWRLAAAWVFGVYILVCALLYIPTIVAGHAGNLAKDMGTAVIVMVVVYASRAAYTFVRTKELARNARLDKQRVEQQALDRRLSPHVLYNTLNAIYAESLEDPHSTPKLVLTLSEMLRHVTDTSESDFTDSESELRFISNLCTITSKRGSNLVRIKLDLPEETDVQIPKLLCSTLVENAISHGRKANGGLDLDIYFSETHDGFIFAVENEVGVDQGPAAKGLGSGINSISKRLAHLYPNRHRFFYGILKNGRFLAEIETW